jgi:hypothetical protein
LLVLERIKQLTGEINMSLPESIKDATRKEKISLLRRAGFTGVTGMTDEDLNKSLLRAMKRIRNGRAK